MNEFQRRTVGLGNHNLSVLHIKEPITVFRTKVILYKLGIVSSLEL